MRAAPLLFLLLAATTPVSPRPGRWLVESAPGTASLDGRPLTDLPYQAPAAPRAICLTADAARDPVAWLAGDTGKGCTFEQRTMAGGRIDLRGTCPPPAEGAPAGTIRLTGRWTPTSYRVRFVTTNPSENGVMGFSGTLSGRRVGDCAS